ncbi:MAG: 4-alpha-glucanotransferase, partial [Muribaculaceae bacterium]|nr:4-alpha-glucanotransferase [Muribaculaceae bacterium]
MKLTLHVNYRTNWGESLFVIGNIPALGDNDINKAVRLNLKDSEYWSLTLDLPTDVKTFEYRYIVKSENGDIKNEWGSPHVFHAATKAEIYELYDRWQDQPWDKPYYSSAFTDCICRRKSTEKSQKPAKGKITLSVAAPMVEPEQTLAICGSVPELGNWDIAKAVRMNAADYPVWTVNIPAKGITQSTEYKFVVLDSATGNLVAWEGGSNRFIGVPVENDNVTVISGLRFINPLSPWKGAGTAIPVFSIRTDSDFGVGDFGDLFEMVDWCVETGQTFL